MFALQKMGDTDAKKTYEQPDNIISAARPMSELTVGIKQRQSVSHFLLHLATVDDEHTVVDGDGGLGQVRRDDDLPHARLGLP